MTYGRTNFRNWDLYLSKSGRKIMNDEYWPLRPVTSSFVLLGELLANWWWRFWGLIHIYNFVQRGSGQVSVAQGWIQRPLTQVSTLFFWFRTALVGGPLTMGTPLAGRLWIEWNEPFGKIFLLTYPFPSPYINICFCMACEVIYLNRVLEM